MKNLFITPTLQFLYPILLLGLIVFLLTTPLETLSSVAEGFFQDQHHLSQLNWKVYR